MEMNITPPEIQAILLHQRDIARSLLEVLTQEYTALSGNDLQGIETNLAAKQRLVEQLEELSLTVLSAASPNSPGNQAGIVRFLKQKDPQGIWDLEKLWQQLDKLLSQCRLKNNTNGKIISLNHRHVQQALEILRSGGQGSQTCYTSTGTSQSPISSRSLGKV